MKYFQTCFVFFGKHNASYYVCLFLLFFLLLIPSYKTLPSAVFPPAMADIFDFEKVRKLTQVFARKHFQSVRWNIARAQKKMKQLRSIYYISRKRSHIETPKKYNIQIEKKMEKITKNTHTNFLISKWIFLFLLCFSFSFLSDENL